MITVLNQPLIKEFPGFIYEQGRPSWLKSTSANSELREFLLRGAQNMPWFRGGAKITTSALAQWHWLEGCPCL